MARIAPVMVGSGYGSPLRRAARARLRAEMAGHRGRPVLAGRFEHGVFVIEVRCRTADQAARITERISREVLGW